MPLPFLTISGRLTADPDLRFTASGIAVLSFTVAANDRKKEGEVWVDGDPIFLDVTAWRQLAENVAEAGLSRGDAVVVTGKLSQETFTTKSGDKRTKVKVTADAVGPDLRWARAQVARIDRDSGPALDVWSGGNDEPPF